MNLFLDTWQTQAVKYIVLTFIGKKCNRAWQGLFLELNIKLIGLHQRQDLKTIHNVLIVIV